MLFSKFQCCYQKLSEGGGKEVRGRHVTEVGRHSMPSHDAILQAGGWVGVDKAGGQGRERGQCDHNRAGSYKGERA